MFKSFVCLFLLTSSALFAGKLPWIGVSFKCPDGKESLEVGLAEGVGLKVRHVIKDGPLDKSGGKQGDLWWKFDNQILVSRGQLVVLLRGKKPGDKVKVDFYREGEMKEISVNLAKWPESRERLISAAGTSKGQPHCSRKLESSKQTASLSVNGESLSLEKRSGGWRFRAEKEGKVLFDKELNRENISTALELRWMEPFMILQLTLEQKSTGKSDHKKARLRYISRKPESKESN